MFVHQVSTTFNLCVNVLSSTMHLHVQMLCSSVDVQFKQIIFCLLFPGMICVGNVVHMLLNTELVSDLFC